MPIVAIVCHYLKFVMSRSSYWESSSAALSALGSACYVTQFFGDFFHFPFLVFAKSPDLYVIAAVLSLLAGVSARSGRCGMWSTWRQRLQCSRLLLRASESCFQTGLA